MVEHYRQEAGLSTVKMTQNVTQRSAISGGKIYLVKTIANFSNVDSGEFPNF